MNRARGIFACTMGLVVLAVVAMLMSRTLAQSGAAASAEAYRSPFDVAYSPDGKWIAVADRTAGQVELIDRASGKIAKQVAIGKPGGLAWSGEQLFAVDYAGACVAQIDVVAGKVARRLPAGAHPVGVAVAAKKQLLLVANSAFADVSIIDLKSGKEAKKIKAVREPFWISVSADESVAVVSNLLPAGNAAETQITAAVTIIDLNRLEKVADVPLPANTTAIRQTAISPDGKWAYAVHTVGRTALPATQLERGWVNTNALSIIDLGSKQVYASVLLDTLSEGAADPWGIAMAKDGGTMWITIAGGHQLAKIDLAGLHKYLAGQPVGNETEKRVLSQPTIWTEIKADPAKRAELVNDLSALYVANLIQRTNLPGKAPRGASLSPDGKELAVGMYYSGQVLLVDPADAKVKSALDLGPQKQADEARQGEVIFHDAHYAFQHWLSCATCHPNEGRADGLNWDLPNDGIGNPKSAKSLLYAHRTVPVMWLGVRDSMDSAAMAGFRFSMYQPKGEDVKAVQAYIRSLAAEPSPWLVNGQLSAKAKRGKAVFENEKVGCARCHSGELYTNQKMIDVGTHGQLDQADQKAFVTPPLVELWRTAPYLHDGRAATMEEMLTKYNAGDRHGHTSALSKEQVEELAEYLLSL